MTNGNDNAFATQDPETDGFNCGLTKREYFAAMAMQGMLSSQDIIDTVTNKLGTSVESLAVECADELIAELNK